MRTEIVNIEEEQQTFTTEVGTANRDIREQIIASITWLCSSNQPVQQQQGYHYASTTKEGKTVRGVQGPSPCIYSTSPSHSNVSTITRTRARGIKLEPRHT